MTASTRPLSRFDFDGQVVLLTGGARGLGRAYAEAFARHHATVVVTDVDGDALSDTVAAIVDGGGSAVGITADVSSARETIGQTLDSFGRMDVLVNNAGVAHSGPFGTDAVADIERLLRVHVLGTVGMTAAAWPALQQCAGRVVNIASGAVFGLPLSTAYATAKGAIVGLTRALAHEPESRVRVNAVMPMARTRMFETAGGIPGSDEDALMTRHFPPEAVSPMVVYLGWSKVACNGQIFEIAGRAASRIAFASGPTLLVDVVEDVERGWSDLSDGDLREVESLVASVGSKLAFVLETDGRRSEGAEDDAAT